MKPAIQTLVAVSAMAMAFTLGSGEAFARKSQRQGFNFGTTVRLISTNDRSIAGEGSDKNTKSAGSSQQVNPYVGYAFDSLNLGLMYTSETGASETSEEAADGSTTVNRTVNHMGRGASLFARFNFGGVFFFEGGGGLYEDRMQVTTETKHSIGNGQFTGEEDSYEVKGVGPGYHIGGGLELAMGNGFYFTSAYQVRMVQLRDYKGGNDLGKKRSQTQKREALFGIAYYDR
jgi:hypothetical protein